MSSEHPHTHVEQSGATDESLQQVHAVLLHRKPEKSEGNPRFPLFLLGLMCAAVFFSAIYLAHYSGRFDASIYNENQQPGGAAAEAVVITPAMRGKKVFQTNCLVCHQANGNGMPGVFPPLAGSEWVNDPAHEPHVVRIVLSGLQGPVTVKGTTYNNVMTPFGPVLKDQQIADVLSYIRQEWGNSAPEVTVETVAAIRAATAGRPAPWTAEELLKLP